MKAELPHPENEQNSQIEQPWWKGYTRLGELFARSDFFLPIYPDEKIIDMSCYPNDLCGAISASGPADPVEVRRFYARPGKNPGFIIVDRVFIKFLDDEVPCEYSLYRMGEDGSSQRSVELVTNEGRNFGVDFSRILLREGNTGLTLAYSTANDSLDWFHLFNYDNNLHLAVTFDSNPRSFQLREKVPPGMELTFYDAAGYAVVLQHTEGKSYEVFRAPFVLDAPRAIGLLFPDKFFGNPQRACMASPTEDASWRHRDILHTVGVNWFGFHS